MSNRTKEFGTKSVLGLSLCIALVASGVFAGSVTNLASGPVLSKGRTSGNVTYSAVGEHGINVNFSAGTYGTIMSAIVDVDAGVADSPFFGDYIADAINTISVDLSCSGHTPTTAKVRLDSSTRRWLADLTFPASAGTVSTAALALKAPATWVPAWGLQDATEAELSSAFAADLLDVQALSVVLQPGHTAGYYPMQDYTIDNVVLVNDDGISTGPASLTALEKAFTARFGYGYGSADRLTDEMKGWDGDGDGMADFMEIWSENDEAYANSIFAAEDIEVVSDGVVVTWTCVSGETYTVLKADSLAGDFGPIAGATLTADDTGFVGLKVPVSAGGYYRIKKH